MLRILPFSALNSIKPFLLQEMLQNSSFFFFKHENALVTEAAVHRCSYNRFY